MRPQEPSPPLPYDAVDVSFDSSTTGTTLAGTLTLPRGTEPMGVILLLSGSGPQDRDESIAGHRPFLVLADHLTRAGFAVLRWDDRGVGASGGDYLAASAEDLVADAGRAMNFVTRETAASKIALVGHSQGTFIATRVAARWPGRVDALVLLAGGGRPGRQVLIDQHRRICRADGLDEATIEASVVVKERLFGILQDADREIDAGGDAPQILTTTREALARTLLGLTEDAPVADEIDDELEDILADLLEWEWRFLLKDDPQTYLRRVRCPVLALAGDRDTQVSARLELPAIQQALGAGGNQDVSCHAMPGLNHLFQLSDSGSPSEYDSIAQTWAPEALAEISRWLSNKLAPATARPMT